MRIPELTSGDMPENNPGGFSAGARVGIPETVDEGILVGNPGENPEEVPV